MFTIPLYTIVFIVFTSLSVIKRYVSEPDRTSSDNESIGCRRLEIYIAGLTTREAGFNRTEWSDHRLWICQGK